MYQWRKNYVLLDEYLVFRYVLLFKKKQSDDNLSFYIRNL